MLPHLAPDRLEDPSLAVSGGPDITFGMRDPDTTVNTSPLGDSKDEISKLKNNWTDPIKQDPQDSGFTKGAQRSVVEDPQPPQQLPAETPPEDVRPPAA